MDDIVVAQIIGMGATAEELVQARAWAGGGLIDGSKPSERVGQLVQIMDKMEDDEEALLAANG